MARTSESDQTRVVLIQMAQVWFRLAETRATGEAAAEAKTRTGDTSEESE